MMKFFACVFIFLTSWLAVPAVTQAGYEVNGGDAVCAEFWEVFDSLVERFKDAPLSMEDRVTVDSILLKRRLIKLSSQPALYLDGAEKDALNYSELGIAEIIISRRSWARLTNAQKDILVLHELLPIAGYFDKTYELSLHLIELAKKSTLPRIPDVVQAILYCDREKLLKLTPADIRKVSNRDLPAVALTSRCELAYGILMNTHWDFNLCDEKRRTALAAAMEEMVLWEKDSLGGIPEGAEMYRDIKNQHETIINILTRAGGTVTCSGTYEEYLAASAP